MPRWRESGTIMKVSAKSLCFFVLLALLLLPACVNAGAPPDSRFVCGGSVEAQVWSLWDKNLRDYMQRAQMQDRLLMLGDVYALYDVQTYTHNLVSMARRCHRKARLLDIARVIRIAYDALEPGMPASPGRRWICRGGTTCNDKNRLLSTEVRLDSIQFLALASSLANALASSGEPLGPEEKSFVRDTAAIVVEHLLRWNDIADIARLRKAIRATPEDMDGSSALYFTDRELWLIAIYAELSGILRADPDMVHLSDDSKSHLSRHLATLLQFFSARLTLRRADGGTLGIARLGDIDRAYWRLSAETRYAGYESESKPVVCRPAADGKISTKPEVRVPPGAVRTRRDTGWDISHARRLVHALDALERNRKAIAGIFPISEKQLPPRGITKAFAGTLVAEVWNGDIGKPLFSNYWSGANGWFRVAYDNGTGACREGYPPYGMSESFVTGGYIAWARYRPHIGVLGRRLYDMINDRDEEYEPFIAKYYPAFSKNASAQGKALSKLMFLSSLVGTVAR
jgi:hypothetical protein